MYDLERGAGDGMVLVLYFFTYTQARTADSAQVNAELFEAPDFKPAIQVSVNECDVRIQEVRVCREFE